MVVCLKKKILFFTLCFLSLGTVRVTDLGVSWNDLERVDLETLKVAHANGPTVDRWPIGGRLQTAAMVVGRLKAGWNTFWDTLGLVGTRSDAFGTGSFCLVSSQNGCGTLRNTPGNIASPLEPVGTDWDT